MKKKLNLTAMAKKSESKRKEELGRKRMNDVRGGIEFFPILPIIIIEPPVPISGQWVEVLCEDWCSVGAKHFSNEADSFDPYADEED